HRMRLTASPIAASALGVLVLAAAPSPAGDLRGYSADAAKVEREWETKFRAIPSPDSLREYMRHLAARPHHVGSPYDKANAEWILAKFKSFGLDAQIETFDVLFPTPKERVVELVAPTKFVAKLQQPPLPGDPTSGQHAGRGRDQGRKAPGHRRGADDYQDSRAADLVRRRPAAARGARRPDGARRVARRTRDHVPRWPRAGEGASAGQVRLEPQAVVRRDRPHSGREPPGRVDHPGQPPRRLGERRRGPDLGPGAAARG